MNVHSDQLPYAQAVRGAVTRICGSSNFRSAPQSKSFLNFVVERVLVGDIRSLKAYTIGVGALGRSIDFNPETDATVRVQAGRVREALTGYYEHEGATDPVIIDLPRGRYVPRFAWRETVEARGAGPNTHASLVFAAEQQRLAQLLVETRRSFALMRANLTDLNFAIHQTHRTLQESRRLLTSATPGLCSASPCLEESSLPRRAHFVQRTTAETRRRCRNAALAR